MKCKDVQLLMVTNSNLPEKAVDHARICVACREFVQDAAVLEAAIPSLDATPPPHLRSRIRERKVNSRRQINWQALAISAAVVVIVTVPVVPLVAKRAMRQYIKGQRIGTLPPFHVKIYGKDAMNVNQDAEGDIWFSGFAIRTTSPHLDSIDDVENGISYQHWKPNGVFEKRIGKWASTGKPVTLADRIKLLDRFGPTFPTYGTMRTTKPNVPIQVFGRNYLTVAITYKLPVTKVGSLTSVETPTSQVVYQELHTRRIIRTELIASFPGGITQTETRDYEYATPSDDNFETTTLKPTQTTFPAKEIKTK